MTSKTIPAGFKIDGETVTDIVRTRLIEGEYRHALKILDAIEGLSIDDQLKILKGTHKLVGDTEIILQQEDANVEQQMHDWYNQKYGSMFKFQSSFYTPEKYIQSWSQDDEHSPRSIVPSEAAAFSAQFEPQLCNNEDEVLAQCPHIRSLYYSSNYHQALAITVENNNSISLPFVGKAVVLFKQVKEEVPFWVDAFLAKDPLSCVHHFAQHHYLQEDGAFLNDDKPHYESSEEKIERYKKQIIEYANNDKQYGWKILENDEGQTIKVPGRAFLHFVAKNIINIYKTDHQIELPPYTPICTSSLKLPNDDPLHTDCWIGAGLSVQKAYDPGAWEYRLFYDKMAECQYELFEYEFNLLHRGSLEHFSGTTVNVHNYESVERGKRILVLPHLGIEFDTVARQCDAVICEQGGRLAHLVIIGRELGFPVIRLDDATVRFALKSDIVIDFTTGKISSIDTPSESLVKKQKNKM